MGGLLEAGAAVGVTTVWLEVADDNAPALALYAGLGYRPVAGYGVYAGEAGAVFLGKDLAASGAAPRGAGEERTWAS